MNFDATISLGNVLTGVSFLIAVVIFVYSMRPRIDNLEQAVRRNLEWQKDQEAISRERDEAIRNLAITVKELATLQKNTQERMERMDARFEKFIDAALAGGRGGTRE